MIIYRIAHETDLPSIAKLYKEGFSNSTYALLSNNLITKFCSMFIGPYHHLLVAVNHQNDVIGFCASFYGINRDFEVLFRKTYRFQIFFNLLWNFILLNPILCKKIIAYFKERHSQPPFPERISLHNIEYIVVTKEYQGSEVAKNLLATYEDILIQNSVCEYALTVRNDNQRAKRFYKKNGFTIVYSNDKYSYLIKTLK